MTWLTIIKFFVIAGFKKLIGGLSRAFKTRKRQREADRAHDDPAGAIADHFGGRVHKLPKTRETDKAGD